MPIVDLAPSPLTAITGRPEGSAVTPGKDELDHGSDTPALRLHPTLAGADTPDVGGVDSVLGAAFRQGNIFGSSIARQDWSYGTGDEPGFNPWDAIKGTKYEPNWDKFVDIRSTAAADARKRQLDMEEEDRRTLAAAPWYKSLPAQLLAGGADIPSLLPGGAFVRGTQGGFSVLRSAAVTGAAAGAGVGLQETALHGTQQTRTLAESGMNIGASVFLGGLLGAAGAKLLSSAEWNRSVALLNSDIARAAPPPLDTGTAHIDAVLSHPDVASAIENPKINRSQDVPYTAGPDNTGNGLNIDRHFPESFAVDGDGNVRAVAATPVETIRGAAYSVAGKTYEAPNHVLAMDKAVEDLKVDYHDLIDLQPGEDFTQKLAAHRAADGFVTSTGRLVSRDEAKVIAEGAEQGKATARLGIKAEDMKMAVAPVKTFDPAQPFAVHEFSERHAMNKLIAGGMDEATAYKVAHWEVAEPAEGKWYEENGIDQAKAEAAYQPFIDQIQHEKLAKGEGDVPANLFRKPYPHDNVNAVSGEKTAVPKPTAEEIARGREILAKGEAQGAAGSGAPASVGAAAHEPAGIESNTIAGRAARAVAAASRPLNPLLRIMQSPSAAVRDIGSRLFENSIYLKKNFEGVASDPAVETLMKEWNGGLVKAMQRTEGAWRDYRKGGGGMKLPEFREEVGRAMRRGDEHVVPEVAAVAKAWRSQVFDPLKEAAIKAGLLPEDVSVDTAASYFSRMWNRNRLIGQGGRFKGIVTDYYNNVIGKEYEKATTGFNARMAKLEQEKEDITLPPEQRAQRLGELETAAEEHEAAGAAYQDLAEKADRLADIAADMRRLKEAGDTMVARQNMAAAKAETAAIKETGGKDLADFIAKRSELRARRRNVDLGAAGLAERSQQVMESLADLEEANQRSLGRLVKKGQKLERELDKIDPDDLAERIGDMRQNFVDVASRADAAADRADKAIAKMKEDAERRAERADTSEDRARVAQAEKKGGVSLLPFLAKRGGISVDDPLAADIRSIFGGNPVIPGHGRLIRKGGRKLDESREAALEAGYLTDEGGAGPSTSTIRDLLEAMDAENRGNKRYRPGEEPSHAFDLEEESARMEDAGYSPRLGRSEKGAAALDAAEAKIAERLEKHAERQRALADRMETISRRLDIAEGFDREGAVAELRAGVEKAVAETSNTSLGRGERAQRMQERLAALDPQRIKDRTTAIDQMKKDLERAYYDRWETKNLGKGVDPQAKDRPDFYDAARDIADTVYNTLTGRTEAGVRPEFMTVGTRGPMKDRTFNIPDELIEDFLEHDVDHVGRRYVRVMGADVEMARKFGSVDMKDQLADIRGNYDRMRERLPDGPQKLALDKQERSDIDDITGVRDLLRGTRQEAPWERSYAKIARMAGYLNYIRTMGEIVLGNFNDAVRPAMVHGLMPYMKTMGQLATNLPTIKMSIEEARLAGNVAERVLASRMATLADISDPYASRGPVEAFLENMSNGLSKWNGIRLWNDMQKSVTAVMTQDRILRGVENFAGTKDKPYLAFMGIDESMAGRIQAQFTAHGENVDGVRVANTEKWTDPVAVRTYRAAMNKDIDSIIVTAGKADLPLFVNTPTGKLFAQFQGYTLSSHQRILLRGLQESPTRFIGGVVANTAMGMAIVYLKALSANRTDKLESMSDNPGWWIAEGFDRAGVIAVPVELANRTEKMTGLNPVKGPMKIFDKGSAESQKNQNRDTFGSVLGPTVGLGEDIFSVAKIPHTLYEDKDVSQAQKNAAVRLMPFQSYYGVRQMMNYVVNPPH